MWPIGTRAHYRQIIWRNLNYHTLQDQSISDDTPNISTPGISVVTHETQSSCSTNPSQLSEEPAAGRFSQSPLEEMEPLSEADLVEFAEYVTPEHQERMSVMLGSDLDRVETLRCKHRENVTGVSLDLLIDWMTCNPQPTNRLVSSITHCLTHSKYNSYKYFCL